MLSAAVTAACLIAAAALIRSAWERKQLKIENHRLYSDRIGKNIRAVFLTDIHDRLTDDGSPDIIEAVAGARPDLILIGGDVITLRKHSGAASDFKSLYSFLSGLPKGCPCFYAEGNHELKLRERFPDKFAEFKDILDSCGIIYLKDSKAVFQDAAIYGISLDQSYYKKSFPGRGKRNGAELSYGYMAKKLGTPDPGKFNILLMHSPLYLEPAAKWGADLVLSGHFHGGTIRLPLLGGVMSPQFHFFLKECAGRHEYKDSVMIVSRGIGTHSINLRINDLPELTVIDLRGKKERQDGSDAEIQT